MCNVIAERISNNQLISRLPVVTLALKNDLFKDYSSEHLFARLNNYSLNFTTNLFYRLETLRQQWGDDIISEIISDKLAAGKSNYSVDAFRQVVSEIEIITYFPRILQNFINDLSYEPTFNGNRNPEIEFVFDNNRYQIEVKSPTFNYCDEIADGDAFINYRVTPERFEEIKTQYEKYHFPKDNKFKDFLESAQGKFSSECADMNSNVYGILVINWDNFVVPNIDSTFDNLDSIFYNSVSGIFTNNSFIKDNNGNPEIFDRVNGILIYQRTIGMYGADDMFADYRLYKKYYIQNPYTKNSPEDFVKRILLAKIIKSKASYDDITILDI